MADRPILFSGPMVRALLDGRKTQTRRVLNPQPPADMGLVGIYAPKLTAVFGYETPDSDSKVPLRYMLGDRLWVRETWTARMIHGWTIADARSRLYQQEILYRADGHQSIDGWWPSIFLPREFSRLTLIVTNVRVQRLREIREADAQAEGMTGEFCDYELYGQSKPYKYEFSGLWDSINAARGYGWDANPWVVAITFTVERRNIDEGGTP